MTRFYLLRHGETVWNLEGNRYCGRTDIPLSPVGREQARKAADALGTVLFTMAFCSPLRRSSETAATIVEGRALDCTRDARLMEIDFGEWDGKTREEIERAYPEDWGRWLCDPGAVVAGRTGETASQVYERANQFFREACDAFPSGTVLVIGHNTLNRIFIAASLGMPLRNYRRLVQGNTGISILELDGGAARWVQVNETAHLSPSFPVERGDPTRDH